MQSTAVPCKKNVNDLHIELSHPSKSITHTTAKAMGIQVTGIFKPYEDYAMGKAKQQGISKKAVAQSKILGKRLFIDVSSPSTPSFGDKNHWLLVVDDSSNYIWSFFSKEKFNFAKTMLGLITNLKN